MRLTSCVVVELAGGLGNQMFQYATARALAKRIGGYLLLDTNAYRHQKLRSFDLQQCQIKARVLPRVFARLINGTVKKSGMISSVASAFSICFTQVTDQSLGYDRNFRSLDGKCRLRGTWQSEKYFLDIASEIREEFQPQSHIRDSLKSPLECLRTQETVAVHIRRGDLVTDRENALQVGTMSPDYYCAAVEIMKSMHPSARFVCFSDDDEWCRKNIIGMEFASDLIGSQTSVSDLYLMSCCDHFILANSTFGWWAAWLAKNTTKTVICPKRFFTAERPWERDLIPPSWMKIDHVPSPPS